MDAKKSNASRTIKVIFLSLLLDILSFTIILPLFPRLLDYYKKEDEQIPSTQVITFITTCDTQRTTNLFRFVKWIIQHLLVYIIPVDVWIFK
jgi:hypothetical protein